MAIIEKLDNMGRGITYIDNKITFVENALPLEEVELTITKSNSKYQEGKTTKIIKKSKDRIEPICPYYSKCGGCKLLHTNYKNTLNFKKQKLEEIINKYSGIKKDIEIIPSSKELYYRNKISLKVKNGKYGYYENNSHTLVEISNCFLVEECINNFIKDISHLNINNGEVIIRSNYNQELLIIINTKEKINIDIDYLKKKHKIVGIVVNNKKYYNDNYYLEMINNKIFKVSYNSFFQVNRTVSSMIFDEIKKYINKEDIVLDLYSGVGVLGINIAPLVKKVYGIEIIENAVINATYNSKINKLDNTYYMVGDVGTNLNKIKDNITSVILDPPRAGLDKKTINYLLENNLQRIIYISCNPITLARDLKDLLLKYKIKSIKGYDMFPYTEHCESVTVLERR